MINVEKLSLKLPAVLILVSTLLGICFSIATWIHDIQARVSGLEHTDVETMTDLKDIKGEIRLVRESQIRIEEKIMRVK